MYTLLFLATISFLIVLVLTPVVRHLARRFNWLDHPDDGRKQHISPTPRVGGIPIVLAYVLSFALLLLFGYAGAGGTLVAQHFSLAARLIPAVAIVFLTGVLDDLIGLNPIQKLAGQFVASAGAYFAGVQFTGAGIDRADLWWSFPATVLWLMICTNALNLIDGLDGLATGVGLFATIAILVVAVQQNNFPLAIATVPLVGGLLAFLIYNFHPASIFLGDCGSLLIGFLLGCFGVIWSQKSTTLIGMLAPAVVLAVPVLDVMLAILRRFLRRDPIFRGDRGHIHHRLLARSLGPRGVALVLYGLSTLAAICAVVQSIAPDHIGRVAIISFCLIACIGVQQLAYIEFRLAARLLLGGGIRHVIREQLHLVQFEQALGAAGSVEECWLAIVEAYPRFGFEQAVFETAGHRYEHRANSGVEFADTWQVRIDLPGASYINLQCRMRPAVQPVCLVGFIDAVKSNVQWRMNRDAAAGRAAVQERPVAVFAAAGND